MLIALVLAAALPPAPLVRRGDVVPVTAAGPGFWITVDAVADSDGAPGARVRLHNKATGERLQALVGDDGLLWLPGFNAGDGGR